MTTARAEKHPYLVLAIVLTAVFVQLLDVSIVNVAIPSIQTDINASFAEVQLVLAGYQLAFACLLITGARLGDIFGRKKLFMIGMATFTVASTLCGLAPNPTTLILARILQGMGSGLMFPQVLSVIQVTIPPKDRGRAFGIFGSTIGIATILGPLVGGLLISLNLFGTDWRMIFLVNIPVGLFALVAASLELPDSRSPDAPGLDLTGAALVTGGLFLLVYPLTEGREKGWPGWIFGMLAASVPLLVAFVLLQRRKTERNQSPLLLMTLFGNRSFRAGLVLSVVFYAGIPSFFFTFGLYLQIGLGFTALHAGLTTFPFALASGITSSRSDALAKRLGTGVLTLGAAGISFGMLALALALHLAGTDASSWQIGPVLLISGLSFGLFLGPLTNVVLAGIHGREAGAASGVLSTVQQVGGALGLAVIGLLLFGLLGSHASTAARDQHPALAKAALGATFIQGFDDCFIARAKSADPSAVPAVCVHKDQPTPPAAITKALADSGVQARKDNFLHAIERTLLAVAGIFAAAALLTRLLPKVTLAAPHPGAPPAEA